MNTCFIEGLLKHAAGADISWLNDLATSGTDLPFIPQQYRAGLQTALSNAKSTLEGANLSPKIQSILPVTPRT